ncbi:NLP/P60 protein [Thermosinus carboxydivorans Nor1]|uniref:NLP/P60 protein n=1 Tax=Thermosinus carboxydivorans Nor1 TaxID=401526 RepID=A1HQ51_9FIRM|nr:NlpC/P60 family protein [Thermosinus carboxydivorans]EAX47898.1 NLP/P60 protein [Thermosinus carboxydivorans Nor1]
MGKVFRTMVLFLLLFMTATFAHASGVYEEGDQGPEIAAIQARLRELGYRLEVDGDFGQATKSAVIAFQKDRGLEADGVVGAQTYRALMGRDMPVSRDSSAARRVIQTAMRYIGVPYVFGGTTPDGFDCSGFTRFVYARAGVYLPRTADAQFEVGQPVSYSRLQPGDMVFFSTYAPGPSHSGIYLGDGNFISATSSRGVVIDRMDSSYWGPRYVGARRVL